MTAIKMLDEAIKNEHVLGLYASDILSLMKEYAAIKCKEQRELCFENAEKWELLEMGDHIPDYCEDAILAAPEPNFD